jgi:hypothetical protein
MEEFDSHTEHAHEQAHEAAQESHEKLITGVALTAAILAALAAITSMLSGHHEHDAMMLQMQATDHWSQYQAKKIKTLLREERLENIELAGGKASDSLRKKIADSEEDQKKIAEQAGAMELDARFHDHLHMILAYGVTLFQVAIAVAAIAALTRRRTFWLVGISLGLCALGFLAAGLLVGGGVVGHRPPDPEEHAAVAVANDSPSAGFLVAVCSLGAHE